MKRFAIPALVGLLTVGIAVAAIQRRTRPAPRTAAPEAVQGSARPTAHRVAAPSPRVAATPPATDVKSAAEQIRVRSTYTSYRAAVAGGNRALEESLLPVLLRDRKAALAFAETDLANATDPNDRAVTEKTLAALRR